MTILITGGTGFLGQRLARALLKEHKNAGVLDSEKSVDLLLVDIREPAELIPGAHHVR